MRSPSTTGRNGYAGPPSGCVAIQVPSVAGQHAVPGDVVGVRVRLDHADEAERRCVADLEHRAHVQRRVDDDRLADVVAADDVRGTAEIARQDLLEDHRARMVPRGSDFT